MDLPVRWLPNQSHVGSHMHGWLWLGQQFPRLTYVILHQPQPLLGYVHLLFLLFPQWLHPGWTSQFLHPVLLWLSSGHLQLHCPAPVGQQFPRLTYVILHQPQPLLGYVHLLFLLFPQWLHPGWTSQFLHPVLLWLSSGHLQLHCPAPVGICCQKWIPQVIPPNSVE